MPFVRVDNVVLVVNEFWVNVVVTLTMMIVIVVVVVEEVDAWATWPASTAARLKKANSMTPVSKTRLRHEPCFRQVALLSVADRS